MEKKLMVERKINRELGRRVAHYKTLSIQQAKRITELEKKLKLNSTNSASRRLSLRPLPNIVEELSRKNSIAPSPGTSISIPSKLTPSSPSTPPQSRRRRSQKLTPSSPSVLRSVSPLLSPSSSPVREQDISFSLSSPQQCTSPQCQQNKKDKHISNGTDVALIALSQSLRKSNASHLTRSIWQEKENTTSITPHRRPCASAFFVTGPKRQDVTHNVNLETATSTPAILHSIGNIDIEDSNSALPSLVEKMCFPNDVQLLPVTNITQSSTGICKLAPISIFCMSVTQKKQNKHGKNNNATTASSAKGPTALYGIFASLDPNCELAILEHASTGTLLHVPLKMCILTYESIELLSLAESLRTILRIEEERMRTRLHRLRRGQTDDDNLNNIDSGAIHGKGIRYGRLCSLAIQQVENVLQTTVKQQTTICDPLTTLPSLLPLFEWGGQHLFTVLSSERILVLLGCALTEQKMIFVSKHLSRLGSSILAFVSLLSPMVWTNPLIPILPSELKHILDAPFPLIVGVTHLNSDDLLARQDDAVIINLDKGRILLPTSVSSCYYEFKLSNCDLLSHELTEIHDKDVIVGTRGKNRRFSRSGGGSNTGKRTGNNGKGLIEMTRKVKVKMMQILKDVEQYVPNVQGVAFAKEIKALNDINPFLARVAGTQMCVHWRQLRSENKKENEVRW
jgi:hypothetical protein